MTHWTSYTFGAVLGAFFLATGVLPAGQDLFSIYWENDSRYTKPNGSTDRHYTNGVKFVYSMQPDWEWVKSFGDWDGQAEQDVRKAVGFFLGHNTYTPNHADNPAKRKDNERVFAGWLYTGLFVQRRAAEVLDHVELNVGVVGPSAKADRLQHCIHEVLGSSKPIGWKSQLGDEPAADFTWVRKRRHDAGFFERHDFVDMITDVGFTAGSLHRHLEAGVTLRCGANLPNDFGPGRLGLPLSAAGMDLHSGHSAYLFARLSGRAVEHDRFLSGLSSRPWVGRAEVGVVCRWDDFEIAYSQTFMTEEFKEQGPTDSYGALTVTWLF